MESRLATAYHCHENQGKSALNLNTKASYTLINFKIDELEQKAKKSSFHLEILALNKKGLFL